jgi:hypothetical protein
MSEGIQRPGAMAGSSDVGPARPAVERSLRPAPAKSGQDRPACFRVTAARTALGSLVPWAGCLRGLGRLHQRGGGAELHRLVAILQAKGAG